MIIGIVSGYFNPLHIGHIEYMESAKSRCDFLVAIVNNDYQVGLKKSKRFMDENHRCQIVYALKAVDMVQLSVDVTLPVCDSIELIRNRFPREHMYFFNSGDRIHKNVDSAEIILCERLKIKYVEINLPKRYSSSELLKTI